MLVIFSTFFRNVTIKFCYLNSGFVRLIFNMLTWLKLGFYSPGMDKMAFKLNFV